MNLARDPFPSGRDPTVLSVDDHPLHNENLSWRLRREGYRIELAETGNEALARIDTGGIDVMLLDINLRGGMSGLDILRKMRATLDPTELPIIMVPTSGEEEMVIETLEHGANDYLTKPVRFPVALARLKKQVSLRGCANAPPTTR